jgi:hypothetical protein
LPSRRREPRFASNFAVTLDGGEGVARNVSASGIYFETRLRFEAGEPLRFTVDYEPSAGGTLKIHCHGSVVRIEKLAEIFGVGARIDEFDFRRKSRGAHGKG